MKRRITAKEQYTTYAKYPLVAGDVRAYELCLDLGEDVSEAEFKVTAIRADGKIIQDLGTVEKGTALYTMASNMYSVPGQLTVRLAVLHDMSVLTEREIIFEVLEGAESTTEAQTVMPLNDSVVLRLVALEQKLYEKEEDLLNALDSHMENTENPHNVTASQIEAYTKYETDAKFELNKASFELRIAGKVDKELGKGLSANDFTDEYKEKLDSWDETLSGKIEETLDVIIAIQNQLIGGDSV